MRMSEAERGICGLSPLRESRYSDPAAFTFVASGVLAILHVSQWVVAARLRRSI
jgi:hypothetical protein